MGSGPSFSQFFPFFSSRSAASNCALAPAARHNRKSGRNVRILSAPTVHSQPRGGAFLQVLRICGRITARGYEGVRWPTSKEP
jgi:hypothetical protein